MLGELITIYKEDQLLRRHKIPPIGNFLNRRPAVQIHPGGLIFNNVKNDWGPVPRLVASRRGVEHSIAKGCPI